LKKKDLSWASQDVDKKSSEGEVGFLVSIIHQGVQPAIGNSKAINFNIVEGEGRGELLSEQGGDEDA